MNKRGIFFTSIAIVLVSILILSFVVHTQNRAGDVNDIKIVRIETVNSFVRSLQDTQFKKMLQTATTNGIYALENYIIQHRQDPNYLAGNDGREELLKAIKGETPYNVYMEEGDNLYGILKFFQTVANETGIDFSYTIINLNISLVDPFTINSTMVLDFKVNSDFQSVVFEKKDYNVEVHTSIADGRFRDPVHLKGIVKNNKRLGFDKMIRNTGKKFDYLKKPSAPDYFQRLSGKFQIDVSVDNPFGMQTIFDPNAYDLVDIGLLPYSYVDYIYFNGKTYGSTIDCYEITEDGIKRRVKLDNINAGFYRLSTKCAPCDCTDPNAGWNPVKLDSKYYDCWVSCKNSATPLLMIRTCGSSCDKQESKCVSDSNNLCGNCDNRCGNGFLETCRVGYEECEPAGFGKCGSNCKYII